MKPEASHCTDEEAIRAIVESRDKQVVHSAPDLDWENAFGVRKNTLSELQAFLDEHLAPTLTEAQRTILETRVRFITPDLALADEYWPNPRAGRRGDRRKERPYNPCPP